MVSRDKEMEAAIVQKSSKDARGSDKQRQGKDAKRQPPHSNAGHWSPVTSLGGIGPMNARVEGGTEASEGRGGDEVRSSLIGRRRRHRGSGRPMSARAEGPAGADRAGRGK